MGMVVFVPAMVVASDANRRAREAREKEEAQARRSRNQEPPAPSAPQPPGVTRYFESNNRFYQSAAKESLLTVATRLGTVDAELRKEFEEDA